LLKLDYELYRHFIDWIDFENQATDVTRKQCATRKHINSDVSRTRWNKVAETTLQAKTVCQYPGPRKKQEKRQEKLHAL